MCYMMNLCKINLSLRFPNRCFQCNNSRVMKKRRLVNTANSHVYVNVPRITITRLLVTEIDAINFYLHQYIFYTNAQFLQLKYFSIQFYTEKPFFYHCLLFLSILHCLVYSITYYEIHPILLKLLSMTSRTSVFPGTIFTSLKVNKSRLSCIKKSFIFRQKHLPSVLKKDKEKQKIILCQFETPRSP